MKVFMVRHGESETNRNGLWTGWLDVPLTEKGREDAALVGVLLSKIGFDKIFSSDLSRARNTADIAIPGCKYDIDQDLREINVGNIAGRSLDIISGDDGIPKNKDGYTAFGGESKAQFNARVVSFMKKLEVSGYENVAVFSHAGFLRSTLDFVVGTELERKKVCCKNCAIGIFEYDGDSWKLHSWINLK